MSYNFEFSAVTFANSFNAEDFGPAGPPEIAVGRRYMPERGGFALVKVDRPLLHREHLVRIAALGLLASAHEWRLVAHWVMAHGTARPGEHEPQLRLYVSLSAPIPGGQASRPCIWGSLDDLRLGDFAEDFERACWVVAHDFAGLS